jgi:hypothetical protein
MMSVRVSSAAGDIVLYSSDVNLISGMWTRAASTTGAGGQKMTTPDTGWAATSAPLASPTHFFEASFTASASTTYQVWLRLRAAGDSKWNESVWLQFSDAIDTAGAPLWRIGTTSALLVNLENCVNCGVSGWGWQDNASWTGQVARVRFPTTGPHRLRVQVREDGVDIDQIVLSPMTWFSSAPGSVTHDNTIVPKTSGAASLTWVRQPYLQQVTSTSAVIVWAVQEAGAGEIRRQIGSGAVTAAPSQVRLVAASTTGMGFDYYQHEAHLTNLTPSTAYSYRVLVNGVDSDTVDPLRTAPSVGSGTVRFVAFGDSGVGSTEQRQLSSLMASDTFDFALHTGDVVYGVSGGVGAGGYTQLHSWFFDIYRSWLRSHPMFPSIGNHDDEANRAAPYRDVFVLPRNGASPRYPDHVERYYSFDYGPAHIVVLDTELAFQDPARRQEQIAWLVDDLMRTSQPWKIAVFHRSPFSAGGEHGSDLTVRSAFAPVFEAHGVSLVLSGHEHDYERTVPWRETSSGQPVTYVVTGGGGAPLYASAVGPWTAFSRSAHHYVRGSISSCTMSLEAVGLNGAVFDSTRLDRCTTPASEVVIHAADVTRLVGSWSRVADGTAAGGFKLSTPDLGQATVNTPSASPNYIEATFNAPAGVAHRLWLRLRGTADSKWNESVWVQLSDSVNASGSPVYRIGSGSGLLVNLENCSGCGIAGWGWQNRAYWLSDTGELRFAASGPHTIRIGVREDGVQLDQIVLSPSRYLSTPPGASKNDGVIVPKP